MSFVPLHSLYFISAGFTKYLIQPAERIASLVPVSEIHNFSKIAIFMNFGVLFKIGTTGTILGIET